MLQRPGLSVSSLFFLRKFQTSTVWIWNRENVTDRFENSVTCMDLSTMAPLVLMAAVLAGVAAVSPMAPSFVIQNDLVSRFFWHALTEVCVPFLLESAKVAMEDAHELNAHQLSA
jgi:hypothetical protein